GTPVPLVIIGDASGSEYRDNLWARQSSTVRFVGYQYGRTYEQLLANSMMYVSASSLEGTSPSLLSAMSAGRCCLVNGIPENVQTAGDSVAMFRQDDWRDLASRWRALAHDAVARQTVAESGKRHQRRYYDWDAIASQYLQEFQASAQAGVDETKRGS
ncbi:MAG: glycosyltransferase, partial [Steroidobacteraceae bacterium]